MDGRMGGWRDGRMGGWRDERGGLRWRGVTQDYSVMTDTSSRGAALAGDRWRATAATLPLALRGGGTPPQPSLSPRAFHPPPTPSGVAPGKYKRQPPVCPPSRQHSSSAPVRTPTSPPPAPVCIINLICLISYFFILIR